MKAPTFVSTIFLALAALVIAVFAAQAQPGGPGIHIAPQIPKLSIPKPPARALFREIVTDGAVQSSGYSCAVGTLAYTPVISEQITPEIAALAANLQNNPAHIYDYVHNDIKYVHYFGSKKGALLTLLEGSGNDFDQCALLVALLRAAGTNAGSAFPASTATYGFGLMQMPYLATGTNADLVHWLGITMTSTLYNDEVNLVNYENYLRGYPLYGTSYYLEPVNDYLSFAFHRVWVVFNDGTNTFCLDPAFKVSTPIPGLNITNAMGLSISGLLNDAISGATVTTNYTQNLNWGNITTALTTYTTNLLQQLSAVCTNCSVEQVLGGFLIQQNKTPPLTPADNPGLPFQVLNNSFTNIAGTNVSIPVQNWTNIPAAYQATINLVVDALDWTNNLADLAAQKLTLTFSNSQAVLSLDDINIASGTGGSGSIARMTNSIHLPTGTWNYASQSLLDDERFDLNDNGWPYQRAATGYVIAYGFDDPNQWLIRRQQRLAGLLRSGYANGSPQVITETLNIMGLSWLQQTYLATAAVDAPQGESPCFLYKSGAIAQETGASSGYYISMPLVFDASSWMAGNPNWSNDPYSTAAFTAGFISSAMEYGAVEELSTNLAASTVKMLYLANAAGQKLVLGNTTNYSAVSNLLSSETIRPYAGSEKNTLLALVNTVGNTVFLPSGSNVVGSWGGYGYCLEVNNSGDFAWGALISGAYGGYSANPGSISPVYVYNSNVNSPSAFLGAPPAQTQQDSADPVNMLDGSFNADRVDLAVGQSEPRGFSLARHYDSNRRYSNPAFIANGWTHRYVMQAFQRSDPAAALGHNTPQEMAAMIVASQAAFAVMNTTPTTTYPQVLEWAVTSLIAEWAVDNLTNNAVAVTMGPNVVQFIHQPDGTYTPPAGVTMTLTKPSGFQLQQRHGSAFNFDATTLLLDTIKDQFGNTMSLSYTTINTTNTVLQKVSDCWSSPRSITFSYNTANPPQLTSISDGTRTVSYYYSSQGDLTNVVDAAGSSWGYLYDNDHKILATLDPLGRVVVTNSVYITNNFNGFPNVVQQYSQGQSSRAWNLYIAGRVSVQQDPFGNQTTFYYDQHNRYIGQTDPDGNSTSFIYDGQDHVIESITPLGETTDYIFDGSNNVIAVVDPLGFTNTFAYDSQNNLIQKMDPRGDVSTFGYNAGFEPIGSTNGAGNWTTFGYNANGTLASRTNSAGATTYGYDAYGQITNVTYPGGLGMAGFKNSIFGDVTNRTDGNGNVTGFQFNALRKLTGVVGPTNLTASIAYDAVGNVLSKTDARLNSTTNLWSVTGKLLAVGQPQTPQGWPVTTYTYDTRDWLSSQSNALSESTVFTNDPAHHLLSVTDPLLRTTVMGYDDDGRLTSSTDPATETTTTSWNGRGQTVLTTDPSLHTALRAYDQAGNQTILTNRNTNVWTFGFDAANRLTNSTSPLGRAAATFYNNRGLVATNISPSGHTTTLAYDARSRLTNRTDSVGTTSFQYDPNSNPTGVAENGQSLSRSYDAYNHLVSYTEANGNTFGYQYDANGNMTNLVYPGGTKHVYYLYDALNRLTNVVDWAGRSTAYAYDLAGHLISTTRPNGTQRIIGYDGAGQVTNILEETSSGSGIAYWMFTNNAASRIQSEFQAPIPHAFTLPTVNMTYDADDRLSTVGGNSVTMDPDGNMTYGPGTNSTFGTYTYDARNRLLSAGGISYGYDPVGTRNWVTNGATVSQFVTDGFGHTLMRIKNGTTNYYVYGRGLIYHADDAGNTYTYHCDKRGSTAAITSGSGAVTDRVEYMPYGTISYRTGTTDTPFFFNGRYGVMTDPNGLIYMRARYYNPYLCRFINADPSGFGGGLNYYAYANGNPVSLIDPFGLGATGDGGVYGWVQNNVAWPAERGFDFLWNMTVVPALTGPASPQVAVDTIGNPLMQMGAYPATDSQLSVNLVPAAQDLQISFAGYGGQIDPGIEASAANGVWDMSPFARGQVIEQILGANLPPNFPVIDSFDWNTGVATSIKSIDLTAPSFQNMSTLSSTLNGYISAVAGFSGQSWAGFSINANQITGLQLQLAIPDGSVSAAQQAVINAAAARALNLGVNFIITPVP